MINSSDPKSAGGIARAKSLTPEERKAIAIKAAKARWEDDSPIAQYEGTFNIGNTEVTAVVLPDGTRLITQAAFLKALGRSRSPKAGTGVLTTVDGLPFFLQANVLKPFIDNELTKSTKPVFYRTEKGKKGVGYRAELLPQVANVYLCLRDKYQEEGKNVPKTFAHIVLACDLVTRALAHVGIVALVDEATGYQSAREHDELQKILDKWLNGYARKWAKTFPDEFWDKLLKAKGYESYIGLPRPQFIGHWVNDVIYKRLAPGVLAKIQEQNPKTKKGNRKFKHFQFLTEDHGAPELREHLTKAITIMDVAIATGQDFDILIDQVLPKYGNTIEMNFTDVADN